MFRYKFSKYIYLLTYTNVIRVRVKKSKMLIGKINLLLYMLKADSLEPQFIFSIFTHCFGALVAIENIEMLMNNLCIDIFSFFFFLSFLKHIFKI